MSQLRDRATGKFASKDWPKLSEKQTEVLLLVHRRITVCLIEHFCGHNVTMRLYKKKKSAYKFDPRLMFFRDQILSKQIINDILGRMTHLGDEDSISKIEQIFLDQRHYKSGMKRKWTHDRIAKVGAEFLKHHNENHIGMLEWYESQEYDIVWSTFREYMLEDHDGYPAPLKKMPV